MKKYCVIVKYSLIDKTDREETIIVLGEDRNDAVLSALNFVLETKKDVLGESFKVISIAYCNTKFDQIADLI